MKARGKNAAYAALNVLLAFVLVVGLAPGASHAADDSGSRASSEAFEEPVLDDLAVEGADAPSDVSPAGEDADQPDPTGGKTISADEPTEGAAEEGAEEPEADAPKAKKAAPRIKLQSSGEGEGPELDSFTVTAEESVKSADIGGVKYYAGKVTVEAKVKATTAELGEGSCLEIVSAKGVKIEETLKDKTEEQGGEPKPEDSTYTFSATVEVPDDGLYTATLKAVGSDDKPIQKKDSLDEGLSYNEDNAYVRTFGIDKTAPSITIGEISAAEGGKHDEASGLYYGSVNVLVTVTDANIDTASGSSGIVLSVSDGYSIQNSDTIAWNTDETDKTKHTANVTIAATGTSDAAPCTLKVTATDKLENKSETVSSAFTIDKSAPRASIELKSSKSAVRYPSDGGESAVDVYGAAVSATVTAEDPAFSVANSKVEVKSRGDGSVLATYSSAYSNISWEKGSGVTYTFTVPAIDKDGAYEIVVTGEDAFGQAASKTASFDVDTRAPTVSLSQPVPKTDTDVKTIGDDTYYKGAVDVTITVSDEQHFDASKLNLVLSDNVKPVTATPANINTATAWTLGEDGAHKTTVTLTGDGPCTVSVSGSDAVGNAITEEATKEAAKRLMFDTAAPSAAITKEDTKVGEAVVQATVKIVVTEANFDENAFSVSVQHTADKDNNAVSDEPEKVSVNWVSQGSGAYAASVLFGEGSKFNAGTYKLAVSGADPVGNALAENTENQTLLSDIKIEQYEPTLRTEINNTVAANKDGKVYYSPSTLPTIVFKVIVSTDEKMTGITLEDGWDNSTTPSWTSSGNYREFAYNLRNHSSLDTLEEGERTVKLKSTSETNPLYGIGVNETSHEWEYKFIYDRIAPVKGESTYSQQGGTEEKKYITGNNPKMTLNITEANFDGDDFTVTAKSETDSSVKATVDDAGWKTTTDDTHTRGISFSGDGTYVVNVTGKDKAGNVLAAEPETVYVDTADPVLDVQFEDVKVFNSSTSDYVSRKAKIKITETNFDPTKIRVNNADTAKGDWTLSEEDGKNVWTYNKPLEYTNDGRNQRLTVEGTDALGRPLVPSPSLTPQGADSPIKDGKYDSGEFTIDTKAPVLKVESPTLTKSGDAYYSNSAVEFKIHVTDANFEIPTVSIGGTALTGINWSQVAETNERVATVVIGGTNPSPIDLTGDKEYKLTITGIDAAGRSLTVADSDTVTSQWFDAETSVYERDFTLDETSPKLTSVSVTGNPLAVSGGSDVTYYNGNVEVKLTVVEANFDPASAIVTVNGEQKSATWTDGTGENANEHIGTVTLTQDALYQVTFSCTDRAGNELANPTGPVEGATFNSETATYTLDTFGIDTKAPQLDVQVPGQASNGYYSAVPTFTVTVDEANFDPAKIKVNGQTTTDAQWTHNGTRHTYQQTYSEQTAKQQLTVEGTDAAGRNLEGSGVVNGSYQSSEFIVDTTPPRLSVSFSGVENGMYSQGAVTATIIVVEQNFDPNLILVDGRALSSGSWSGGGTTHTATVTYSDDGSHVLTVSGTDAATHQLQGDGSTTVVNGTYTSSEMIVDNIDPQLTVKMTAPTNGRYYNTDVTVEATIEEANFSEDSIQVSAEGSKSQSWENTGTTHKLTVVYSDESQSLNFGISGVDLSGRPLASGDDGATEVVDGTYRSIDFVIDKTTPVVKVALSQPVAVNAYRGNDYFKQALTLGALVTVDDANFDVSADTAHRADDVILLSGKPMNGYSASGWGSGKAYSQAFGPNDDLANPSDLVVTVYDLAGNTVTYAYGDADASKGSTVDSEGHALAGDAFLLDVAAPRIEPGSGADIPTRKPSNDYEGTYKGELLFFSSATTMMVKVVDELGVSSVRQVGDDSTYSITVDGQAGDTSRMVTVRLENGKEFTKDFVLNVVDTAGNWREWEINPKDGKVSDVSGSSTTNTTLYGDKDSLYPTKAILDSVNPKVSFDNRVKAGNYYNATQTERLSIDELNFRYLVSYNGSTPVLTISKQSGDASRAQTANVIRANRFKTDRATSGAYYYDMTFADDGHYSLEASFSDPAGNKSNTAEIKEFTIDKTAPRVDVTWDNNSATNGRYYASGRTATVVVTEHNFSAGLINVSTNGSVGGWTTDGDRHTVVVSFGSDGTYDLGITGRDLAGNELPAYTADQFVVDTTAPTVSISFADASEGQRAFNGLVQPVIAFSDEANYDSAGASFTLRGNKTGDVQYDFSRVGSDNGETVTYADFAHVIGVDDIYTLTATLTDMAGNQAAEATETFSVNRFGSNFIVESPVSQDGNTSDLGYLSEAPDITIREINVSGIEESSVAITYNLKTTSLDRKSMSGEPGYVVQNLGDQSRYGWQEYDYIISKESFTGEAGSESPDGNYVVVLSSKDSTGNTNSSANFWVAKDDERKSADAGEEETDSEKRMSAAVKFTLDTTPPEVVGLSVENNQVIDAAGGQEVSFIATDTIGFDERNGVLIKVDGNKADYDIDGSGKVTFTVPEQRGVFQPIEITVSDYANNTFKQGVSEDGQEPFVVKVSSDFFDLHMPYIVGGGAAVVVAGAAVGIFFIRPRMAARAAAKAATAAAAKAVEK